MPPTATKHTRTRFIDTAKVPALCLLHRSKQQTLSVPELEEAFKKYHIERTRVVLYTTITDLVQNGLVEWVPDKVTHEDALKQLAEMAETGMSPKHPIPARRFQLTMHGRVLARMINLAYAHYAHKIKSDTTETRTFVVGSKKIPVNGIAVERRQILQRTYADFASAHQQEQVCH